MYYNLGINVVGDFFNESQRDLLDHVSLNWGERSQNLGWTTKALAKLW